LSNEATALFGLDWGTTSLRAYRIGCGGEVLERRSREAGILRVPGGDYAAALLAAIGDWWDRAPAAPVIASGMIGSRQGWREIPYVDCPAGLEELARGLGEADLPDGRRMLIVPGLLRPAGEGSFPDVMRGEETQILGERRAPSGRYVLPGTHSKWALCETGRISSFATYMTGELFDVLRHHSILGRLMTGDAPDEAAFGRGLERARASATAPPGRLLHDLFSARTLGLTDAVAGTALASYLSGLLIGSEILAALDGASAGEIVVLGSGTLTELYARAIAATPVRVVAGPSDAAARGLYAVACAAGLIRSEGDA
jgi:2-dehydro-3-deoxygalactonokinase